MAFVHSSAGRILLNEDHVSAYVTGYTFTHRRELSDVTTVLDTGSKWLPGLLTGSLSVRALHDPAAGALHEEIYAAIGTDDAALWTFFPDGYTLGQPALIASTDVEGYTVDATVREAVTLGIETAPNDGVDVGVSLHALSAETADGNGTSVDNTAASSNGGVATLHVTAFSGLTDAVIKIQDSANNTDFADIITFTTVTSTTWERKTVTGAVRRYVRATVDVTGTGSVTYAVAFARR